MNFSAYTSGVPKCLLRLAARRLIGVQKLFLLVHDAHPAPAAARRSFDNERKADFPGFLGELIFAFDDAFAAGNGGHAQRLHFAARAVLLSHHLDDFGRGSDERDFGSFADLGEIGIFGEKAVARVDGVHIRDFRGADHLRNI